MRSSCLKVTVKKSWSLVLASNSGFYLILLVLITICLFCNFRRKLSTHSMEHWRWDSQKEIWVFRPLLLFCKEVVAHYVHYVLTYVSACLH